MNKVAFKMGDLVLVTIDVELDAPDISFIAVVLSTSDHAMSVYCSRTQDIYFVPPDWCSVI